MNAVLLVVALLVTAAVLGAGLFLTLRAFRAADRPQVEVKPRVKSNPHDAATTAQLKHFFEGKACAACSQPIPPVHTFELRPGLLHARTHDAIGWDDIPAANLSATLENHVPICASCMITETFRRQHPELVVDRHRPIENPSR